MGRKYLTVIVVVVALSLLGGGGTWTTRISDKGRGSSSDYYRAVMTDLTRLGLHDLGYEAMVCYLDVVCPVIAAISLPVDVVIDTLLVPHDFTRASNHEGFDYQSVIGQESYGFLGLAFSAPDGHADFERPISYSVKYWRGERKYYVYVFDVPLKNAEAKIYIPFVGGYVPRSVSVSYGDLYRFEMEVALIGGVWGRESLGDPAAGSDSDPQVEVFTSDDRSAYRPKTQVAVTSHLTVKDVRLATDPGYMPRGHGT